jgi:hypothetical protein
MLNMGDFNTHNSDEACYQALVNPANPAFRFYDPPFAPDASVSYPADWDNNPASYAAFLTTSTRLSGSVPNSCGTSGGGKSWYDHIFVSQSIIQHTAGIAYIPHSYRTLGNDGNRTGISVNDAPANTAVSAAVADALFQMSNKYPVMVNLLVSPTASGIASLYEPQEVTVPSPVHNMLQVQLSARWAGTTMPAICSDMAGRVVMNFACNGTTAVPCGLAPGTYVIHLFAPGQVFRPVIFTKE